MLLTITSLLTYLLSTFYQIYLRNIVHKILSLHAQKELALAAENPSDKKYTEKVQMFYCSLIQICFITKCFLNNEYVVNKQKCKNASFARIY